MKLFVNIIDSIRDAVKWFYLFIVVRSWCVCALCVSHINSSSTNAIAMHCKMEMNGSERATVASHGAHIKQNPWDIMMGTHTHSHTHSIQWLCGFVFLLLISLSCHCCVVKCAFVYVCVCVSVRACVVETKSQDMHVNQNKSSNRLS